LCALSGWKHSYGIYLVYSVMDIVSKAVYYESSGSFDPIMIHINVYKKRDSVRKNSIENYDL
jgi:hypothetical protein